MNIETENTLPAKQPGKSLTIAARRLAGSPACLNCGTELKGPFCFYCGQPDKNLMRFFPALLRELLEDTFDFDSRFLRTIKPLLFMPGKLTRDYLDGRRFRYVPPLRLYIFSSIAFFFVAALLTTDSIHITDDQEHATEIGIQFDEEDQGKLTEALKDVDPALAEEVKQTIREARGENIAAEDGEDDNTIDFNGEPWDRETNPLIIPLAPDWVNNWVNNEIGESPEKGRQIEKNPDLIKDKVFDVFPITMFVLLPIVALLFKFWYLFAKKYYVEHLIFALHNHAFLFVVLLIIMLANTYAGWQEPTEEGPVTTAVTWINIVIGVWIPVYLLVSLKRVYQQGWWMTAAKFSCIGMSYLVLLTLTTTFVAVLSFVLL
jgi:hypothetical protein